MLRPDAQFAETRALAVTDAMLRREPTYRRDALVPFFRPNNVLMGLGVPMPIIDNDITLPAPERFDRRELADGNPGGGRRRAGGRLDHDQPEAVVFARQPVLHADGRRGLAVRA